MFDFNNGHSFKNEEKTYVYLCAVAVGRGVGEAQFSADGSVVKQEGAWLGEAGEWPSLQQYIEQHYDGCTGVSGGEGGT